MSAAWRRQGLLPARGELSACTKPAAPPHLPQECVGINLANQTGREGKLSAAYADAARAFSAGSPGFRLEPFDFHKQCGATNYAQLGLLWEVRRLGAAGGGAVRLGCSGWGGWELGRWRGAGMGPAVAVWNGAGPG